MPVALPAVPLMAEVTPQLVSFGSDLTPATGGPVTRMRRFGSRYSVQVALPTLDALCGGAWIAALLQAEAEGDTLRLTWPQADLGLSPTLAVNANGGGQAGATLAVTALNAPVPPGAFFSFLGADGHEYLHSVTQAAAAGAITLSIAPMLRQPPPPSAALNFATPTIEGFADDNSRSWKHQRRRWTALTLKITEDR